MNNKKIRNSLALALVAFGSLSLTGCDLFNKNPDENGNGQNEDKDSFFAFSVGMKSGAYTIYTNSANESIEIYNNGIDTDGRTYTFSSTDESVATIDANGKITPKKAGTVNFIVKEAKSNKQKALKKDVTIVDPATNFSGGANYSGGTRKEELDKNAQILGALEKYAMDTHLTGITLFDNGGYVRYSDRVKLPTTQYIQGYGFGLLAEGRLNGTLSGDEGKKNPDYLHEAISQDSLKINQYTATGSQVSDLASYITATYWNTRLKGETEYEWYPSLAADKVKAPKVNASGEITSYDEEKTNSVPIPMEATNATNLYKKWRVYVKTDGVNGANLKFTTASEALKAKGLNRGVKIADYEFAYKILLTGSNNIIRGTEMANDTSYGIKGAQRYFNETKNAKTEEEINKKWKEFVDNDKLGIHTGHDDTNNLDYLDIELINPIDEFTAMYTLSSSLVSPLPEEMFVGEKAIDKTMKDSIQLYGTFGKGGVDDKILDYTICLGAFTLTKWTKNQEIVYARNDDWFEHKNDARYHIPGVDFRVIDTSTDTEKVWKQLENGNLDSAGVPSKKTAEWKDRTDANVFPTKGDSTFKLNVNSCTKEEWNTLFGPQGKWPADGSWDIKPWMSNDDFLDGLFYSIDRQAFAEKRGVTPSINYFSDAYQMRNATEGTSYNEYQAHKTAVAGYSDNYGYSYDKAVDCFRNAVQQLSRANKLTLGTDKDHPTEISIHIRWMYQTDIKEYGEDIKSYFESAFNDQSVCGGKVKLRVDQDAVTNWEDVYNVWMMQGRFDLGFGAISGNTYNPLNFMEVLKSDNSSSFTLNWGTDTSLVDDKNPIIYDGKKYSFDALWEVADHGGIVENGKKVDPVKSLTANPPTKLDGSTNRENNLFNGFKLVLPVEFSESESAVFDASRFDIYVLGAGNVTVAEGSDYIKYNRSKKQIEVTVTEEKAKEVNNKIKEQNGWDKGTTEDWQKNPFTVDRRGSLFDYEFYYSLSINGGSQSINYGEIKNSDN